MRSLASIAPMLLLIAACATRTEPIRPAATARGVAPALAVERFLQAANRDDLVTMGRLFGTRDGPVIERDPREEVEKRMFAIAAILKHEDYQIEDERIVPGRADATQLVVRMKIGQRQVPVAYTLVRSEDGAWLIEMIDLEAITSGR
ncbi:MAG TPA: hypothetical protein VF192_06215 [Longimicrobiales bacterium]